MVRVQPGAVEDPGSPVNEAAECTSATVEDRGRLVLRFPSSYLTVSINCGSFLRESL